MTLATEPLVALAAGLGIDQPALVAVEGPQRIHHQFSVSLEHMRGLAPETITAAIDEYGDAFSLELRTGDLIEITIGAASKPDEIARFLAGASGSYDAVVRLDKNFLLARLGLSDPEVEARLYLFTDALCALFQRGLAEIESQLWRDPTRQLRIYLADSDATLSGTWLSIRGVNRSEPSNPLTHAEKSHAIRMRDQRDRFIGWDEPWVTMLTPSHIRVEGSATDLTLRSLVHGQFVALAILYLCDRARFRFLPDGAREIRAEFRGQAHVAVIPLVDGTTVEESAEQGLQSIASLVGWIYSIDETTDRDWVADRLPFVQTRVAQMLEGRPEETRLSAFIQDAKYLVEGVEWQWKAFIEGRISAYLENRKDLEALVGDTVVAFRERGSELLKGLSDNILAAVGVLIGTFIAAAFADPFNEDLFRVGMIVYGAYLLLFPGFIGLSAHSVRFTSARSDFDARLDSYKRLLGSEVDKLVGSRVNTATRDYWIATVIAGLFYLLIGVAAFCAADRLPPLIKG